jgi:hypothetical protein
MIIIIVQFKSEARTQAELKVQIILGYACKWPISPTSWSSMDGLLPLVWGTTAGPPQVIYTPKVREAHETTVDSPAKVVPEMMENSNYSADVFRNLNAVVHFVITAFLHAFTINIFKIIIH